MIFWLYINYPKSTKSCDVLKYNFSIPIEGSLDKP